ncbi:MAG: polyprenol monophosphomannose synthase [Chloroflexi bacterium]|nr:polyprenol monophosphomannose synthase [Chloroflexota bacterium]
MPTYNEAENLPLMANQLFSLGVEGLGLIIVDDNSPDGTGQIADSLAQQYPHQIKVVHRPGKMGVGSAYIHAFRMALDMGADYIFEMDADFSHPPEVVPTMIAMMKDYYVAVGSRYVDGGGVDPKWGLWRKFLSWGGNVYARWVTGVRVKDATAGFKCFRRLVLEELDLAKVESGGYVFQVEMAYACQKRGYRVVEVPITFIERARGRSKMSWGIIWEAAWRVWQIKRRY